MVNFMKSNQTVKKNIFFLVVIFFSICYTSNAQTDTIYFDTNWKVCSKTLATYYRLPPEKIATKKAVGYKIKSIDSLYAINDYYSKTQKLQFQGFSADEEAKIIIGVSKWYDQNQTVLFSKNNNYNSKSKPFSTTKAWQPIFYINYAITVKSQFTGGLEFCLDCESKSKLFLGLGYGISSYGKRYFGLPDVYLSYNTEYLLFVKMGGSNRNVYSLLGVSLLNFVDLGFGYSYPILKDTAPELKSFIFGLTFRLTNNQDAYTPLKIGL